MPTSGTAPSGEEMEWLFDFVMAIFRSPSWEVPIMTFIDENCVVFDNEEESKVSHSEVHEVRACVQTVYIVRRR